MNGNNNDLFVLYKLDLTADSQRKRRCRHLYNGVVDHFEINRYSVVATATVAAADGMG